MTPGDVLIAERMLTVDDRCDKCQAPARVAVRFAAGELLFCRHDYVSLQLGIVEKAERIRWMPEP